MNSQMLYVSPDTKSADLLSRMLGPLPLVVEHASDVRRARAKLGETPFRAILTDARLPDGSWHDVLCLAQGVWPVPQVIVTDPLADDFLWAEVLNIGGYDVLAQPFRESEVCRTFSHFCANQKAARTTAAGCMAL